MRGPRERMAELGASRLSDAELLAVLVGTGRTGHDALSLATNLMAQAGGLHTLRDASVHELCATAGIGPAKATRIAAAFELGARALHAHPDHLPALSNSRAVFERYGSALAAEPVERFIAIATDAKNRPRAIREVARGGRSWCQVDPAAVFRALVREGASGAVFVHNHPSGDPTPSPEDLALTERLVRAGDLLGISVLDHLIVGGRSFVSLRDTGRIGDSPVISKPTRPNLP